MNKFKSKVFVFSALIASFVLLFSIIIFLKSDFREAETKINTLTEEDCIICDRISLVINCKNLINDKLWVISNPIGNQQPLFYFTAKKTYLTFFQDSLKTINHYEFISCNNNLQLKKLNYRFDDRPFHMENKMVFGDSSSVFYKNPIMLCSDVESLIKLVPDFSNTEDWLQVVSHEYFHSFQFSHKNIMNYLSEEIKISSDSLTNIYLNHPEYRKALKEENELLLLALNETSKIKRFNHINKFIKTRTQRREDFENKTGVNINTSENFWEKIEGSARYVEYYLAGNFNDLTYKKSSCDTLFNNFSAYKNIENFEALEKSKKRTEIMEAYYYVTGFNMCRLLDKMKIDYKSMLFSSGKTNLYSILKSIAEG